MAHYAAPFLAPPLYTPPDLFATPLTAPAFNSEPENEAEWDYEYSSTETETYYVTLDLTTAQVPPTRKAQPFGGRNRKVRWVNTGLEITKKRERRNSLISKGKGFVRPGTGNHVTRQAEREGEDEDEHNATDKDDDEEDNFEHQPGGDANPRGATSANEGPKQPRSVQILDLHSKNPVVSYDGQIYSCQWVSNIGTELLFTRHEPDNPLPSLRTLPGDVDLLAASSARIISTSLEIHPNEQNPVHPLTPSRRSGKGRELGISIGRGASNQRKDQALFIERLMNIKEEKGENDPVTVYAHSRKTNWRWNEHINKKQSAEKLKLQKAIKRGGKAAKLAKERLEIIEKDEARRKAQIAARNKTRGPSAGNERSSVHENTPKPKKGRPSRRGLGALAVTPEVHRPSTMGTPGYEMESMAASSPQRFESEGQEDSEVGDEEMEDGRSGEEELYDAEDLYDEDAPGEDDDTDMYKGYG